MKQLIVTIDQKGKVEVEAQGFAGGECKQATKPLVDHLGLVIEDVETPDMYRVEKAFHTQGA